MASGRARDGVGSLSRKQKETEEYLSAIKLREVLQVSPI